MQIITTRERVLARIKATDDAFNKKSETIKSAAITEKPKKVKKKREKKVEEIKEERDTVITIP